MAKEITVVFRKFYLHGNHNGSYSCTYPENMFHLFTDDPEVVRILDEDGNEIWYNWNRGWDYWGF